MKDTVADVLLARLREWKVKQVFAFPGDGINGLLAAWGRAENDPQFVQARHEEMAAFAAVGCAKFSGQVGVCAATSGPGAVHLLNGLYDAKLDHVPVVAIVGQTERSAMGGAYQQEVDLLSLFKDVCSESAPRCAATSPPANMPPTCTTCAPCSRSWTVCNWTSSAAAGTPAGCAAPPWPNRRTWTSPRTAHHPCTRSSMAHPRCAAARCTPTPRHPGTG